MKEEESHGLIEDRINNLEHEVIILKEELEELIVEAKTFFELVEKKKKC